MISNNNNNAPYNKLLTESSTKHCELDFSPVWLIKSLCHVFVPILVLLIIARYSHVLYLLLTSVLSFVLALKNQALTFLTLQITVLSQIFPSFPNLLSVQFTSNFQITLNQIHFFHSFNLVSVASILLKQLFLKSIMTLS